MKTIMILTMLLLHTFCIAQSEPQNHYSKKELKIVLKKQKSKSKSLEKLADQRVSFLQRELNLNNHASYQVKKAILKYSIQADKVLQSGLPKKEKTKSLSNIIYFQNEEFKRFLTVDQFYRYINLK
ncbi:hypothetical protein ABW636_14900 [Aquimarina sp. 2201CG1-2-11]|uniref:hypothetical protein n=1 Tax=Aquimarina discodermiae TaxID=3231043 RepID=UPI0034624B33